MITKISKLGSQFFHVGIIGLLLSILFTEYTNEFLYAHYQGWIGWRSVTGSDPNFITSIIKKISWAILFFSSWYMLWKFDSFFISGTKKTPEEKNQDNSEGPESNEESQSKSSIKKEKDLDDTKEGNDQEKEIFEPESEDLEEVEFKFNFADLKYAETLGLKEPFALDDIKPSYRKIIAQYHPDRVAAMGNEIQEVAEKKAKEINRAYDYFQKKFDLS